MMHPRLPAVVLGVVLLVAASCGGTSSSPSPAIASPSASASAQPTVQPTSAAAPCPASAGFTSALNDHGALASRGPTLEVDAGDFFFAPTCTSEVASGTVTVVVTNTGQALHNVAIADQGLDQDIAAGESVTVQVQVGASPVLFVCKYHRTSGMVGALIPVGS